MDKEKMLQSAASTDLQTIFLLDHSYTIAKKSNMRSLADRCILSARNLSQADTPSASSALSLLLVGSIEADLSLDDVTALGTLNSLSSALSSIEPAELKSVGTDMTRTYVRLIEYWRRHVKMHADTLCQSINTGEKRCKCLRAGVRLFSWWIDASKSDNSWIPLAKKAAGTVVQGAISAIKADFSSFENHEPAVTTEVMKEFEWIKYICETLGFMEGLEWTSSVVYNFGSGYYNVGKGTEAVWFFRNSCEMLKNRIRNIDESDFEEQKFKEMRDLLARRYEALGVSYNALARFEESDVAFKEAICGMDTTTVVANGVISETSMKKMLEKIMKTFFSRNGNQGFFEFLDDAVDSRLRSALLEFEFEYLVGIDVSQNEKSAERLLKVLNRILDSLTEPSSTVKVARSIHLVVLVIILNFLRYMVYRANISRLLDKSVEIALPECLKAIEILLTQDERIRTTDECMSELAIAYTSLGVFYHDIDDHRMSPFDSALQLWTKILVKLPPSQPKLAGFSHDIRLHSVERSFKSLSSLSQTFHLLRQHQKRINCLQLMQKMLSLRSIDRRTSLEESVDIISSIASASISLGRLDRSEDLFNEALRICEDPGNEISPEVSAKLGLAYADYLCYVGNLEKGNWVCDRSLSVEEIGFNKTDFLNFTCLGLFVHSKVALLSGKLPSSVTKGAKAVAKLNSFWQHGRSSEWRLSSAQLLLELISWTGWTYQLQGSLTEAEYFYKKGLELAGTCHSVPYRVCFLEQLTELNYKQGQVGHGRECLALAANLKEKIDYEHTLSDRIMLLLRQGELYFREGNLEDSMKYFVQAKEFADEDELSKSERMTAIALAAEPLTKSKILKKTKSTLLERKRKATKDTEVAKILHEGERLNSAGRIATVLTFQNQCLEAEKVLNAVNTVSCTGIEHAEHLYALANAKIKSLLQTLSGNPLLEMFPDSAFSIPWCVPAKAASSVNRQSNRKVIGVNFEKNLVQMEDLVFLAFHKSKMFGAPDLSFRICIQIALLTFIRAYLSGGSNDNNPKSSLACTFYLDQAKGVTSKREMRAISEEKADGSGTATQKYSVFEQEANWTPTTLCTEIIDLIPESWIIVSLSADADLNDLYISRISAKNHEPVVFRLPMKRQAIREGEDTGFGLHDILAELDDIIATSDSSAKLAAQLAAERREQTREERVSWWKTRKQLDARLKDLLGQIEQYWIGGFKGLLLKDDFLDEKFTEALAEFKLSVERLIVKAVSGKTRVKPVPLDRDLCCMLLRLGIEPDPMDVEDILYYLMDSYQYAGCSIGYDELNMDMVSTR
ncbi:hypothetical protein HDU84_009188 [Entophlyctis sp. JEL0112]|nr:hypothetical protein HDU84_009188 [Entophlyctis sp. JEL0112]